MNARNTVTVTVTVTVTATREYQVTCFNYFHEANLLKALYCLHTASPKSRVSHSDSEVSKHSTRTVLNIIALYKFLSTLLHLFATSLITTLSRSIAAVSFTRHVLISNNSVLKSVISVHNYYKRYGMYGILNYRTNFTVSGFTYPVNLPTTSFTISTGWLLAKTFF